MRDGGIGDRSGKLRKVVPPMATTAMVAASLAGAVQPADAATFSVTNLNDSGAGSLRDAVTQANGTAGADTITFGPGLTGTITLTTGRLAITGDTTVDGPGAAVLTVSGNDASQVFYVAGSVTSVTISGLTVTHGRSAVGGAIRSLAPATTLEDLVVTASSATGDGGAIALDSFGTLAQRFVIRDTTVSGNTASRYGGGIYIEDTPQGGALLDHVTATGNNAGFGGGVALYDPDGPVTLLDTSVTGNSAGSRGGGVYLYGMDSGDFVIDRSTVSGNTSNYGGGILSDHDPITVDSSTVSGNQGNYGGGGVFLGSSVASTISHSAIVGNDGNSTGGGIAAPSGPVAVGHSVVADNNAAAGPDVYVPGTLTLDHSLVEDLGGSTYTDGGGNITGEDPELGPLADNGGPTRTHLPAATSPLVDAGDPAIASPPATDQRGRARIVGSAIDIGPVEYAPPATPAPSAPAPAPESAPIPARPGGDAQPSLTLQTSRGPVRVTLFGGTGEAGTLRVPSEPPVVPADTTVGLELLGRPFEVQVVGTTFQHAEVCLPYDPAAAAAAGIDPSRLQLFHLAAEREVVTSRVDPAAREVCGTVRSLSPFAVGGFATERLAGTDAAATAAAISADTFRAPVPVAYLAPVGSADALVGAAAASAAGGPLLLTERDRIPAATLGELARLNPARLVVVGGSVAVSDAVVAQLREIAPVTRLAGADRRTTAAAVAGSFRPGVPVAYVVRDDSVADGLVATGAADGGPVLLTGRSSLPAVTGDALARLRPGKIVVVGGTAAVSDEVVAELRRIAPVSRLAGVDRYATSAAVLRAAALGTPVLVATGEAPADALAAAAAARARRAVVVLVRPDAVLAAVAEALNADHPATITVVGGTRAVSLPTELDLAAHLPK